MKEEWTAREISEALRITERAIRKKIRPSSRASRTRGGGYKNIYYIRDLPADVQMALVEKEASPISPEIMNDLAPEAQLMAYRKTMPAEQFSFSREIKRVADPQQELFDRHFPQRHLPLSPDVLQDERVGDIAQIVQEAQNVPPGFKKAKWIRMVAIRFGKSPSSVYRYLDKYDKAGLAGLKHRKSSRGKPKSWTPEAVDFWLGMCLKKEHRKMSKESLYECLLTEAHKRGWQVGEYRSAMWWLNKRLTPQLLALQRGGMRALDNTLPPICRDYSDLRPFEILVGDQHRFDFWVMDDETGEVFRPEGYFWQDLRTRCFYGGAVAERYDSFLMGLALRIGLKRFGIFGSIYTDHGKPEESKYMMGVLKEMRALGLGMEQTVDIPVDLGDADPEEIVSRIRMPGQHVKAVVRNAKAKMIESTNRALENILRNHLKIPGYVKTLTASKEEQEIDEKEAGKLAISGKLPTFREFVLAVYRGMDFYNDGKPHRGVLREWLWAPKPKEATPMQCLKMCFERDAWRPKRLPEEAADIAFLPRERRMVDRGRITFRKERYEDEALIGLNGDKVEIRFDPLDASWLLVFHRGEFLCRAEPVEYSSMKDRGLAERKIGEKSGRKKAFLEEYRQLISWVPDFREYSRVPAAERTAALVGRAKQKALRRSEEEAERCRTRSEEELAKEVARIEDYVERPLKIVPADKPIFQDEIGRYRWLLDRRAAGMEIDSEDGAFVAKMESGMTPDVREYWEIYKEGIGIKNRELGEGER